MFEYLNDARKNEDALFIYYSGHGVEGSGAWCFSGGNVADIIEVCAKYKTKDQYIYIMSDSCFSGDLAVRLKNFEKKSSNITVIAASYPGWPAWDGIGTTKTWVDNCDKLGEDKIIGCWSELTPNGTFQFTYGINPLSKISSKTKENFLKTHQQYQNKAQKTFKC
eukprot:84525_1